MYYEIDEWGDDRVECVEGGWVGIGIGCVCVRGRQAVYSF